MKITYKGETKNYYWDQKLKYCIYYINNAWI